jgi:hypothetical protein
MDSHKSGQTGTITLTYREHTRTIQYSGFRICSSYTGSTEQIMEKTNHGRMSGYEYKG